MTGDVLQIDGSMGEGGGQILRSALTLALITGQGFEIEKIRTNRGNPGLQRQHLAAVEAAATIGQAEVTGADRGSQSLRFLPQPIVPADYHFNVGTAGSTTLVLQTVLPALLQASGSSALLLEGGTHNPMAPPFEFLDKTFLPLIRAMGPRVNAKLDRHGFYPTGGGKIRVLIDPTPELKRLDLLTRGKVRMRATALVANLPRLIGERELKVLKRELDLDASDLDIEEIRTPAPGNVVLVEAVSNEITEVFSSFGAKEIRSETVASRAVEEVKRYLQAEVPVGEHLADQLLLPMAIGAGGSFLTLPLTMHSLTNIEVLKMFLPVQIQTTVLSEHAVKVEVTPVRDANPKVTSD
ncbi:MAG TPA: RNA 3'-terminal phosphate cyclase [Candidatus Saccharimonadales bacterium]|nr:RNA 3'-terminal phosphate cyclase [Candidatus Saccharimonadales bacterium]